MNNTINDVMEYANSMIDAYKDSEKEEPINEAILPTNKDNVVSSEKLREIQSLTLASTKDFLSKTFGPMGSNTKIIKGQNQQEITSSYSKDGLKVLSNIINSGPIEASIVDELISVTRAVEKEVGDGTTSTVILASLIFDRLRTLEKKYNIPPFKICRVFQSVVAEIIEKIENEGRECTIDDIYNISMISTNGNEEVSRSIKDIYEQYGMDVELSVGISNNANTAIKVYDGLTITEGFADPAFINNKEAASSEIYNAHVYHFADPIDTMGQIALFEAILTHNIYEPYENDEEPIPTVIVCPKLSNDLSATMKTLISQLYSFDSSNASSAKPPVLIISDVVASDEIIMDDIANLCGCKTIRKYIDREIYNADVEKGIAPTEENVFDFFGEAELVISDNKKTKFINPKHMVEDENGNKGSMYYSMLNFLETELDTALHNSESVNEIGLLKKRISALKANMVEYLVGGVTVAERDMNKDLVEDAIKNCKSASLYGVGHAANFMGLSKSLDIVNKYNENTDVEDYNIRKDIAISIFASYVDITSILYRTVCLDEDKVKEAVFKSLDNNYPFNISSGELSLDDESGKNVLCSIKLDINILNTLSKIITMMVTCNQALLQASHLNVY